MQVNNASLTPRIPPRFRHRDTDYVLIESPSRFRNVRASNAWSHGALYARLEEESKIAGWRCSHCNTFLICPMGAVATVQRHLERTHRIKERRTPSQVSSNRPASTAASETENDASVSVRTIYQTVDLTNFRKQITRWCIEEHVPFYKLDSSAFHNVLQSISSSIGKFIPSATTLSRWAREEYNIEKEKIKSLLRSALSKIHLSFDLWTSPNGYAIIAVVAHCVIQDSTGTHNQALLLALKRMRYRHRGEDIAEVLIQVILDYSLERLGVFIADNVESNDTAIKHTLAVIEPQEYDWGARRSRCIGHIINLAAKAFLFGQDIDAFEFDVGSDSKSVSFNLEQLKRSQSLWRRRGPVGKLHNVIVFIRSSPQRKEAFKRVKIGDEAIDNLMPVQDNSTRWNSHYLSILRALKLHKRLDIFIDAYNKDIGSDSLSLSDWNHLKEIAQALKPFERVTQSLQSSAGHGHHGSVWEWLPTIEVLLKSMETGRDQYKDTPIGVAYQNAWQKLQKYYQLSDKAHTIYVAATLFCPLARKYYFDRNWTTNAMELWKEQALKKVYDYWHKEYEPGHQQSGLDKPDDTDINPIDIQLGFVGATEDNDQYTQYVEGQPLWTKSRSDTDLLGWWSTVGPSTLRQMAYDLLSIPATSAEVERVFSSAKKLITPERNALTDDSIEVYEVLRNWWRHDIVLQSQEPRETQEDSEDED